MRRFFAPPENFSDNKIILSAEESKHLRDVLRLHVGSMVAIFDGVGREFACVVEKIGRRDESCRLQVSQQIEPPAPESDLDLTVAIALLKGERFDLAVQKITELGVKKIVPLQTKRADALVKDERDAVKKAERWRRIALEACKQSGRATLPTVELPVKFEKFLENSENETRILFAERGGEKLNQTFAEKNTGLTAIIGAEGGWEDAEIEAARKKGCHIVTLGGRILRAETAAIICAALLQHLGGDLR